MVVVVMGGREATVHGAGTTRFGPAKDRGEQRASKTGSVRMVVPAMSRLKWPSYGNW